MTLSATTVHIGDAVHFTGTGFTPHQRVLAMLDQRALRLRHADGSGTVEGTVHIPWAHRGMHMFSLTAWHGPQHTCSVQIQVIGAAYPPAGGTPGGGGGPNGGWEDGHGQHTWHSGSEHGLTTAGGDDSLAKTGAEKALAYGGAAAGMIAAGGGMLLAMRRRRSS
ncbi:LPXTG cell wall anchor domain-containing protein [Streptomyces sp. NPDC047022]|uniref:LPXTG cell wall anchor domain-containing protein n=1 Tax=Streptomyces sp. NPDC047022 TaxID=3155737 RepID=UPI0033DFFD47